MTNSRLSRGLCATVASVLNGSHQTLDALFISSGAPGEPPDLAHHSKWKEWLFRAGQDTSVDSLEFLGNILEEFMDAPPVDPDARETWEGNRDRVVAALEADGLRYFRGGRVMPTNQEPSELPQFEGTQAPPIKPTSIDQLLQVLINGLPRAMYPLQHRRKGSVSLTFESEYDIQDLLHSMMKPWIKDIRPEESTPSYAGTSTRMDF